MTSETQSKIDAIKRFITDKLTESGMYGYVVGLSGGIDSSLAATLAVQAVGAEKVYGISMPYKLSSESSKSDAQKLTDFLAIEMCTIDISPMIDQYFPTIDQSTQLRAGNKMARERMSILFDVASERNSLVLGTGNRTEICLGYTTLYGDSACSVNPIGDLYKSEVWELAMALDIPESIIKKTPTADLWENQTDEGEIGVKYHDIDKILRHIVDDKIISKSELDKLGCNSTDIEIVVSLLNRNYFKRVSPEIANLGKPEVPVRVDLND